MRRVNFELMIIALGMMLLILAILLAGAGAGLKSRDGSTPVPYRDRRSGWDALGYIESGRTGA